MNNLIPFKIPSILEDILKTYKKLEQLNFSRWMCSRLFFDISVKDYDIEIFGIDSLEIIQKSLEKFGSVKLVGKSFGVLTLKVDEYDFDFALPRTEEKNRLSHQDF